jgi:8-oxo-dGTP pyrophosphatase MutT (NUDIX family)
MEKERSAGAVIFKKNKETEYLLLHYEAGHWDFPKGNIEKNEKEEDTIKREVEEETGLKGIKIINDFKEKIHYFYRLKGKLISKEVVFYLAETKKVKIKLSFEHIGFEWLCFEKALEKLTFKNSKNILKKANDFLRRNPRLSEFLG